MITPPAANAAADSSGAPPDDQAGRLWALLFQLVLDAEKQIAAQLARHGLTVPQFYVLKTLTEQGGRCPIGEIARLHGLTNATMTGLVGRMEIFDPPLVQREPSRADKRSVVVVLTEAGRARYQDVQDHLLDKLRVVLSLIDPAGQAALVDEVARYITIIRAAIATP